jgi:hypothetical protein
MKDRYCAASAVCSCANRSLRINVDQCFRSLHDKKKYCQLSKLSAAVKKTFKVSAQNTTRLGRQLLQVAACDKTLFFGRLFMIEIEAIRDNTFKVVVQGTDSTTHIVTVDPSYYEKLTANQVSIETLIRKSFEFLLQRESNTNILRSFGLPAIAEYFPEYETAIQAMLE